MEQEQCQNETKVTVEKEIHPQVKFLLTLEKLDQRSDAWLKFRFGKLSTSDWGIIMSKSKYNTKRSLLKRKCTPEKFKKLTGKAIMHGIKYEEVAVKIYKHMENDTVLMFGCVPHPKIPFLASSPDGIRPNGIMLEIKCPYTRILTGIPSEEYWTQVQGQMEVCDLEESDFFECQIREFSTKEEFLASKSEYKGAVITYMTNKNMDYVYKYSKLVGAQITPEQLDNWIQKKKAKYQLKKADKYQYMETKYWYLEKYSKVRIKRDREWFNNVALPTLTEFWNDVVECRQNPTLIEDKQYSDDDSEPPVQTQNNLEGECMFGEVINQMEKVHITKPNNCLFE